MRIYFIMFVSLAVISAIVSIKNVAVAVVMLSFGLALPLLFAQSALIYLLCLLPAFASWPSRGTRFLGLGVSLALCLLVAVFPGILSRHEAKAIAEAASTSDRKVDGPVQARSMEILRPAVFDPNNGASPFSSEPCPPECRYLLVSGQMDWIRINMTVTHWNGRGKNKTEQQASTFVAASGSECDPEHKDAPGDRRCVLIGADNNAVAALRTVITQSVLKPGAGTLLTEQRAMRRISLTGLREGRQAVLHQSTESVIARTTMPFLVAPDFRYGMESEGFEIMRSVRRYNEISLRGALEDAGYDFTNVEQVVDQPRSYNDNRPPSDNLTLEVVSILDLPGTQPFNQHQMDSINRWVTQARGFASKRSPVPLTPVARTILERLITDRRVQFVSFIDQALARNPDFLAEIIPVILTELETVGMPRDVLKSAARVLADLDTATLAPYAARIIAIRRNKFPSGYDPLSRTAGKLGLNPVPLLALSLDDKDYVQKLSAFCHADKAWSQDILAATFAYLEGIDPRDRALRDKLDGIESALMRHGGWERLAPIYASRFPGRLDRMEARERRLRRYPDRCL
jgi:hypothetical protein